ncbi:MAG: M28 family peptidase [Ferruginibacter sp.]
MKYIFWLLLFSFHFADAQKLKKADKLILSNLEVHINYLADDKLEGRRTGTNGEKLAYEYISNEFEKAGLAPKGENDGYLQEFEINDGKEVTPVSHLIINGNDLKINEEYFPFSFSPDASLEATTSIALQENSSPWFYDIKELMEANKNNPHFDLTAGIKTNAAKAAKKGANAFIIFNTSAIDDELKFEPKSKSDQLSIPVLYISRTAKEKYMKGETETLDIKLKIAIADKKRYGHNVIGYINNNAATTIIIGAHYDHLGYGEDHNSLYTGDTREIHNGADDNASGTGALIELGKMLKAANFKNNNFLVIAFSGEELGLFGSKYFTEHPTVSLANVNYMVNMDMIGRLRDSTHSLSIGGYGTSPEWSVVLLKKDKYFTLNFDSSGTGPSDHTSFYRKDIPVLFFFTGTHPDYHKPTDDASKINFTGELQVVKFIYALIEKTNKKGKLAFEKTRETQMNTRSSFKVTLGIMPDYTYSGAGVRADGVIDGRPAQKAGIKTGDVIIQLGDYKFSDLQAYMETLNKFNKGDATKVKVKRGNEELVFDIIF